MRCHFLTAVWGPWHTQAFLRLNLPSLLAPGNLPAFARDIDTTYVIGTSESDAQAMQDAPIVRLLQKTVKLRFVTYRDSAFGAPVATHMKIWQNGVRAAKRDDAFFMVNPADMIWAEGSFGNIAKRLKGGSKAIYALFARVVEETFRPELAHGHAPDAPISIPSRAMVDMTLRHFHPLHAAYLRDSDQFPFHAEYIYWPVRGQGLLMRSLATTALVFHARRYAVNSNFSLSQVHDPGEVAFIDDSDEMFGVSLTPLLKDRDWYSDFRRADLDEIGAWWITFDGPAHLDLARSRIRFHTGAADGPDWRRAELQSDFFVVQSLIAREMIRLGRLLRRRHCQTAAECLATALYAARLRRRWRWRGPVTIFAPSDDSLKQHGDRVDRELLAPGCEKRLIDFAFGHLVPQALALDGGDQSDIRTANGHRLDIKRGQKTTTVGGRRVLQRVELPLGNVLHIVDGPLPSGGFET
jgi:hypothetical protein